MKGKNDLKNPLIGLQSKIPDLEKAVMQQYQ